jgi:hypothetical protein
VPRLSFLRRGERPAGALVHKRETGSIELPQSLAQQSHVFKNTQTTSSPVATCSKVALSHSPNLQQQGEPHGPWTISLCKIMFLNYFIFWTRNFDFERDCNGLSVPGQMFQLLSLEGGTGQFNWLANVQLFKIPETLPACRASMRSIIHIFLAKHAAWHHVHAVRTQW